MNLQELRNKLASSNIDENTYSLEGGLPNEAYCLNSINDKWEIYYSERGQKTRVSLFEDEEQACNHFYSLLESRTT